MMSHTMTLQEIIEDIHALMRRREQYKQMMNELHKQVPTFAKILERTAHREPIPIAA